MHTQLWQLKKIESLFPNEKEKEREKMITFGST